MSIPLAIDTYAFRFDPELVVPFRLGYYSVRKECAMLGQVKAHFIPVQVRNSANPSKIVTDAKVVVAKPIGQGSIPSTTNYKGEATVFFEGDPLEDVRLYVEAKGFKYYSSPLLPLREAEKGVTALVTEINGTEPAVTLLINDSPKSMVSTSAGSFPWTSVLIGGGALVVIVAAFLVLRRE